jgi:hypothetical protein
LIQDFTPPSLRRLESCHGISALLDDPTGEYIGGTLRAPADARNVWFHEDAAPRAAKDSPSEENLCSLVTLFIDGGIQDA